MSDSSARANRIGFTGVLFFIFLTLKLIGQKPVADWSWWWIFSPFWIPLTIGVFLIGVGVLLNWLALRCK